MVVVVDCAALCYAFFLDYGFGFLNGKTLRRRAVFYVEADLSARPSHYFLFQEYHLGRFRQHGDLRGVFWARQARLQLCVGGPHGIGMDY